MTSTYEARESFPIRRYIAPMTALGRVTFVNIRPDQKSPMMWMCDTCGTRVTISHQERHSRDHR